MPRARSSSWRNHSFDFGSAVHAGIVVPPHNLFDALLYCDAAAASLKLLFSAFVLSEYVARVPLELRNGNAHCHRVRTLLTLVRRRTVDCKTALFVAQQCAPVALGDGDVASRAADFAHVASVAFDDVTDAIVAHPQFVMLFWPQVLAHTSRSAPAPRATEQQPQSDEAELKKKSKYWCGATVVGVRLSHGCSGFFVLIISCCR